MRVLAQITNPVLPPSIGSGDYTKGGTALGGIIGNILGGLFIAGFLLAFVFLITGAISWISSGGDKQKLESARDQITNAIVGIVIVAAAWAIMRLAGSFLGLPSIENLPIPSVQAP